MKKNKLLLLLMLCFSIAIYAQDEDVEDDMDDDMEMEVDHDVDNELMMDAEKAKQAFIESHSMMKIHMADASGYVIFPNVGKGALIVGVSSGNGIVYSGDQVVGAADLKKVDIGLQAGGKAVSELIIFKTAEAFNRFKNNEFEFAAGASAVVLKSGKEVNAKYNDGVAVFAISKAGLMAEASVGGQKFHFHPIN